MRSNGKLVHLICFEPIGVTSRARQPWSDTWVKTSTGKKKWLRLGPTIIGRDDLRNTLDFERNFRRDHPEHDDGGEEQRHLERALAAVNGGEFYFDPVGGDECPTLYVPSDYVDRSLVEAAIRRYLAERHGIERCRFKWRRTKGVVHPMTIQSRTPEEAT